MGPVPAGGSALRVKHGHGQGLLSSTHVRIFRTSSKGAFFLAHLAAWDASCVSSDSGDGKVSSLKMAATSRVARDARPLGNDRRMARTRETGRPGERGG